ncbi:MAG: replication factor C small subunit [Promethearchaeota archaeon]
MSSSTIGAIEQPWVEKYRPRHLNDVVGHGPIIERLKGFAKDNSMPHLIFAGPAGTGKTTSALALVRDIQKNKMRHNQTYLELNASDARGIDVIRTMVKDFAKGVVPEGVPFKILILDEADNMTAPAQQALRRTMENYTANCRMILICNYSNKIILPIQSRCVLFRFDKLKIDEVENRLKYIATKEGVNLQEDGLKALIYVSNGDLRRAVNYLQACSTVSASITEDIVYKITGRIHPDEVKNMLLTALKGDLVKSKEMLNNFILKYGVSARNLIGQIHSILYNIPSEEIDEITKIKIIRVLSQIDYRLSQGATERVQLNALLGKILLIKKF